MYMYMYNDHPNPVMSISEQDGIIQVLSILHTGWQSAVLLSGGVAVCE